MAKKSMILKQQREPKFSSRRYNRCKICGRPHAYLRDYGICRICFRELAYKGQIPDPRRQEGFLVKSPYAAERRPAAHGCSFAAVLSLREFSLRSGRGHALFPHIP